MNEIEKYEGNEIEVLTPSEMVMVLSKRREAVKILLQEHMIEGVHYGTIPGCPKPSLWKAGAELVLSLFNISVGTPDINDMSTEDKRKYRITVPAYSENGRMVGVGVGSCSSSEKKYITQDAETIDNTILKMAHKRALVSLTLTVGAVSDIFTQDIEDMPKEYISQSKPDYKPPEKKSGGRTINDKQAGLFWHKAKESAFTDGEIKDKLKDKFGITTHKDIPADRFNDVLNWLESGPHDD